MKGFLVIERKEENVTFNVINGDGERQKLTVPRHSLLPERVPGHLLSELMVQLLSVIDRGRNDDFNVMALGGHPKPARSEVEDNEKVYRVGPVVIDVSRHRVYVSDREIFLTGSEFRILVFLTERLGRVQSRDQLLEGVWSYEAFESSRTVDVHIRRLRVKLGEAQQLIKTIRGFGYKMEWAKS